MRAPAGCPTVDAGRRCGVVRGWLDGGDEFVDFAKLLNARNVGVEGEEGVLGAKQGVARSDGHADELVVAA